MADIPKMDIPEGVRDMAEKNVEQAKQAYTQLLDMMRKSQDMASKSSGTMTQVGLDIQAKAMRFTEENMEAGFKLAAELARARDMAEFFEIQNRHATRQLHTYTYQAQQLGLLIAEAAQKVQPRS